MTDNIEMVESEVFLNRNKNLLFWFKAKQRHLGLNLLKKTRKETPEEEAPAFAES